jgi:predicted ATPase
MVKKLLFSNFYSYLNKTEVSFEIGKKPSSSKYDIELEEGQRLNKVIGIIGANGSGKTQLLRPFAFLCWFITNSYNELKPEENIPFQPHAMHKDKKSAFELHFMIDNSEYKYLLSIQNNEVHYEALYKKTSKQFSYVFVREKEGDEYSVKQQGFGMAAKVAQKIRSNASLLSAAYMNDVEKSVKFKHYFSTFSFNVTVAGRENYNENALIESAKYFHDNQQLYKKMNELLCNLDLGLSSVSIEEVKVDARDGGTKNIFMPFGEHKTEEGAFKLSFFEESSGTKSVFVLLKKILAVLEYGGLAIIDEIDNDLHPHMLPVILDLFKFEHSNPKQAQIIFTCHTPEVLNLLKKHQIYLVEKQDLVSEAWRLDSVVGLRVDDNVYAKYQAGLLGAIPDV